MTDFSADRSQLADAIYGGPPIAPAAVERLLAAWGLVTSPPLHVLALDAPQPLPSTFLPRRVRHVVLNVHQGIAYVLIEDANGVTVALAAAKRRDVVAGESRACDAPAALVGAIQQAVLSFRRKQLGPGATAATGLTQLAEGQARALAMHRVRSRHPQADEAMASWLDVVISRHQEKLNTVRRKLIEGLCLLTLEHDTGWELAYPFQAAARRLLEPFTLPGLRRAFEDSVRDIGPLLAVGGGDAGTSSLVSDARAYLAEHYRDDIGLAQTARHLRCSATHLSRAFKESTGRTLTAYLQSLRVARAKELLLETDGPLRVVAPAAGFATAKHFHRVFLRQTGLTPHAFRAAYRR